MENELFEIWEKGNLELFKKTEITKDMITDYLNKKTIQTSRFFNFNIVFYTLISFVNVVLSSMNIVAYRSNNLFQSILIALLVLSSGALIYGILLFINFRDIRNFSDSLNNLINKQLHFIKIKYEIWLFILSLSFLIMIFNINIIVDYNDGYYPINNKTLYLLVNVFLFLFIYGVNKISGYRMVYNLKAYLVDLKKGILEESIRMEKKAKKSRWIAIVLIIIFTITLIAGILKSLDIIYK